MRRIIREEEPPQPSTRFSTMGEQARSVSIAAQSQQRPQAARARLVRGELDWIVMKALEKDRSRRYDTANGLRRATSSVTCTMSRSRLARHRQSIVFASLPGGKRPGW